MCDIGSPSTSTGTTETITNYLNDLLGAVSLNNNKSSLCGSCEEGHEATSRCNECNDFLCDACVLAHSRLRLTKDHQIINFLNKKNRTESLGYYSSGASATSSPPTTINAINIICDIHNEPHRLYCETCHVSACTECIVNHHAGHHLCYLENAIEEASQNSFKLASETKSAILAVKDALDKVQRMSGRIDLKLYKTSMDVKATISSYFLALERRQEELLSKIDQVRRTKENHIQTQMDNLRMALSKLVYINETITESLESSNILDMIPANKKALNELKKIRSIQNELIPCEDDNIYFTSPDNNYLRAIYQLGNINATLNSPPIIRTRDLPSISENNILPSYTDIFAPSRPIYGANGLVCVKDTGPYPSLTYGDEGAGDGQLCRPWGICCNHLGQIIVADRSNNRIQIFDSNGKFLHKFGNYGQKKGEFDRPAGITINPLGNIVVADKDNHRIQIFKIDGTFLMTFGQKGSGNGEFNYPWDVACNSQSHIVVSDTRNHRLQLFTGEGNFICKYGFENASPMWKHFDSPRGVAFTPSGKIIVTDFNNHRLVILDKYLQNAQFLGGEGSNIKQFLRPQGVVCDDQGRIIVADSRNNRIQVIDANGTFLFRIGLSGRNPGEFDRPTGITLNPEGRIVVIDFGNSRVQVF